MDAWPPLAQVTKISCDLSAKRASLTPAGMFWSAFGKQSAKEDIDAAGDNTGAREITTVSYIDNECIVARVDGRFFKLLSLSEPLRLPDPLFYSIAKILCHCRYRHRHIVFNAAVEAHWAVACMKSETQGLIGMEPIDFIRSFDRAGHLTARTSAFSD